MNTDVQSAHQPDGLHRGKVSHRHLNEEVLQSAVEAAKDEVLGVDASNKSHAAGPVHKPSHLSSVASGLYKSVEDRATRFALLKPMQASLIAASAGALLALFVERSLKKLISRRR